jgi:hypothetical protein
MRYRTTLAAASTLMNVTASNRASAAATTTKGGSGRPFAIAICHNGALGDSGNHADHRQYPQKYSTLGFRIGVNYVIYSMTHRGEPKI